MGRTHEPCVPTCLLPANHPAILLILKFNIQNSKFKVQAPYIAGMTILLRDMPRMVLQSEWGYAPNYFVFLSHRPCNWKILAIFVKHSSCECSHEP